MLSDVVPADFLDQYSDEFTELKRKHERKKTAGLEVEQEPCRPPFSFTAEAQGKRF